MGMVLVDRLFFFSKVCFASLVWHSRALVSPFAATPDAINPCHNAEGECSVPSYCRALASELIAELEPGPDPGHHCVQSKNPGVRTHLVHVHLGTGKVRVQVQFTEFTLIL